MRFVPRYTVSYRGQFYRAGVPFEIADTDAAMMEKHGTAIRPPPEPVIDPEPPKRRRKKHDTA